MVARRTKDKDRQRSQFFIAPAFEAILDSIPTNYDFMFGHDKPPSGFSKAKKNLDKEMATLAADEFGGTLTPWRLHDLRRTFRTGLARLGVSTEVAERCCPSSDNFRQLAV